MVDRYQFDVFLAHNSKDKDAVRAIARKLEAEGLTIWFDEKQIYWAEDIPERVAEGINRSLVAAFFIGTHDQGLFQRKIELGKLIDKHCRGEMLVGVCLLPGVDDFPEINAISLLSSKRYLKFDSIDSNQPLNELVSAIKRKKAECSSENFLGIQDGREASLDLAWNELVNIFRNCTVENLTEACGKALWDCLDRTEIKICCCDRDYPALRRWFLEDHSLTGSDRWRLVDLIDSLLQKQDSDELLRWIEAHGVKFGIKANSPVVREKPQKSLACLLILIEKENSLWRVRGQVLIDGKHQEIKLEKAHIGVECPSFGKIAIAIKRYIDYVDEQPEFYDIFDDQIRVELFLPISEIHRNLDELTVENQNIVCDNQIHLRCLERGRKNRRRRQLEKGWQGLHQRDFSSLTPNCELTKWGIKSLSQVAEISTNPTKYARDLSSAKFWGLRLVDEGLPTEAATRNKLFDCVFNSGLPVAFWHWDSIPPESVEFEKKFKTFLCPEMLGDRCQKLLYECWVLRSDARGEQNESAQKNYAGYYLGMLLEDPDILPSDDPLETIGVAS
ncbi:MAG: TIR domain-containing protein [Cyanobacteria bacterium P01_H01_bin.15]